MYIRYFWRGGKHDFFSPDPVGHAELSLPSGRGLWNLPSNITRQGVNLWEESAII